MTKKIREYLLSFAPLFIACPVLFLLQIPFPHITIFFIAYLWHLFLTFPGTSEKMALRGYRFAFVRLIYLFYATLTKYLNKKKYFLLDSLLRALGPFLFMGGLHYLIGGVNFYMLFLGCAYYELFLFTRSQLSARVPPPLP